MSLEAKPIMFERLTDTQSLQIAGPQLKDALQRDAAVWVYTPGLTASIVATEQAARAFFKLSESAKMAVKGTGQGFWRGYQPVLESELLERYEIGPVQPNARDLLSPKYSAMEGGNIWPPSMNIFREVCTQLYVELHALTIKIVGIVAQELRLPGSDIPEWTDKQFSSLVLNSYLPNQASNDNQARLVEHTDHGGITLLALDGTPGLEVEVPGRGWVKPVHRPNCLLLMIGEMLQQWTAEEIRATRHRVRPAPTHVQDPRTTLVWFHNPSPDAAITARGENAGEFFMAREREYQESLPHGRRGGAFES